MDDAARYYERVRWRPAYSAAAVPAWGLVRVTGLHTDNEALAVTTPNADSQFPLLVASPTGIPAGGFGSVTGDSPIPVAYATGDGTPAVGDVWGTIASGHLLRKDRAGWRCVAAGSGGVAEWVREDRTQLRGKLDGALSQGGSATISVWKWNGSSNADSGENVTVYDTLLLSGESVSSGKWVWAGYDAASGRWYAVSAECET